MGSLSVWHWLLFLAVALLMFGGSGKISSIMGDVAKGIKSFKKGMAEDDEPAKKDEPPKVLEGAGESRRSSTRPRSPARPAGAPRADWSSLALSGCLGRAAIPRGHNRARERASGLSLG